MGNKAKLQRLQDLFAVGEVINVQHGGEVLTLFVAKPSAFEQEEAVKDARGIRARSMIAFDRDDAAQDNMALLLLESSAEDLVAHLMMKQGMQNLHRAKTEITTDLEWRERIEALERMSVGELDEDEVAAMHATQAEYNAELLRIKARMDLDSKDELDSLSYDELASEYRKDLRETHGINAYYDARRVSEIYFALRDCSAEFKDGEWDHGTCGRHPRFLDERGDVKTLLPDLVIDKTIEVLDRLTMTEAEAGNSDAPSVSSGPLELQKLAEALSPSSPTEM